MQQSTTATRQGPLGIFYGWWLLGIGAIIVTVGSLQTGVTSVFFLPIQRDLGLTSAALSLVFTVSRFEGGLEGPVVGWLIDKRGPKLPIIIGAALGGVGLLVLSQANSYLYFFVVYITMVSLGFQMGFLQCMHAVANLWFIRYRTRAMSVYSSSFRVGWAIFTPIVAVMVLNYGWRNSAVVLGVFVLATALPLSLLIRRSPESMGLMPDGDRPTETPEMQKNKDEPISKACGHQCAGGHGLQGLSQDHVLLDNCLQHHSAPFNSNGSWRTRHTYVRLERHGGASRREPGWSHCRNSRAHDSGHWAGWETR